MLEISEHSGCNHTAGDLSVGCGPKEGVNEGRCNERRVTLSMVDITAKLTVTVEVQNYDQVVRKDKGRFLGHITKVPGLNSFIEGKVDETVEQEVKKNLEQTLPKRLADELTKGLGQEGVQASVNVSLTY